MPDIFNFNSYEKTFYLASFEEIIYDLNDLIPNPPVSDLGNLSIATYKLDYSGYKKQFYGINIFDEPLPNNIFTPEPSLNWNEIYTFSFIDNVENKYTRVYNLSNVVIKIKTCDDECNSCWTGYYNCTDCDDPNYATLEDKEAECFPITYIVDNYIYDDESHKFLKCYSTCEFCSESIDTASSDSQKCISCLPGYLYSYVNLGNCYEYDNLEITEDKEVISNKFAQSDCLIYKIAATGECVNECPSSSPYYTYIYNNVTQIYEKVNNKPPKYIYKDVCYEECPYNYEPDNDNNCVCNNAYYKISEGENEIIYCLPDDNCPNEYPYKYKDSKECFSSLDDCDYLFNGKCYTDCSGDGKLKLIDQTLNVQNYFKEILSLDNNVINKLCVCDINNGVWINETINNNYYQKCLDSCPLGYDPEEITNQCIFKFIPTTNIIVTTQEIIETTNQVIESTYGATSIPSEDTTNIENNIDSTTAQYNEITSYSSIKSAEKLTSDFELLPPNPPIPPHPPINDKPDCPVHLENECYSECPQGTCLTQEDPELKTCVRKSPFTQVFNGICFEHFESFVDNIKTISENKEVFEKNGVIITGYSTKENNVDKDSKNSIVYLGDCEYKLKLYYNLSNDTELFILGIDSPNKDSSASTNTYNYGVYLSDGTLLEHNNACKESKIVVSSPIINPELVKLDEASYFYEMGYDIFDVNSDFYSDVCSPVSINGNDIILKDRKKSFYPSNVSLCNDSCYYSSIDFETKRFTCECDLVYNFSKKNENNDEEEEEEEDISYIEYFLSLINYKIIKCYKLFFEYKSYYYNAGFYIAVGNLIFCLASMIIFIKWGIKKINLNILENVPSKIKLQELYDEPKKRTSKEISNKSTRKMVELIENPPKKNSEGDIISRDSDKKPKKEKNKSSVRKSVQFKLENEVSQKNRSKSHHKSRKSRKINSSNIRCISNQNPFVNSKEKIVIYNKKENMTSVNTISSTEKLHNQKFSDESIDSRELNTISFTQAKRLDNRNYFQMFMSVIFSEIKIIRIFYYKNIFEHLSIALSEYTFELCLDLTLNCLLYTEEVISEKYNNNGSIQFFTTLSLSFMSNIISSIICFVISKLIDYFEILEFIVKDMTDRAKYFLVILKFKKVLCFKLTVFFIIQTIFNLMMCYYLMIFCTVYHKTQGSIMINYITGIAESLAISFGLALITSLMRYLSIRCSSKSMYNTSRYFFEKF